MIDLKKYFDLELRTTLIYAVVGVIVGYISFLLNHTVYAIIAAVIAGILITVAMKFVFKINEGYKWWLGNGGVIYLFVWFVVWTVLYNVYVI